MHSPHDPLLTLDQAGDLLGTGPDLPARLVAEGQLDHVQDGDDVRVPQSALIAYAVGLASADDVSADSATEIAHPDAA